MPDKNAVLAHCKKLKDRINLLKAESQKVQTQIEDRKEQYGTRKGIEDAKKQGRIESINERGKKISTRLAAIPKDIAGLKKEESDKNKTKIENLEKEEAKLLTEQKNIRIWKKNVASDYSKSVRELRKSIKNLVAKRDSLHKEIKKLQDEYDNKLKSLVSPS
jgi:archaellum component FlaC